MPGLKTLTTLKTAQKASKAPETDHQWEKWLQTIVNQFPARFRDDLMQEARLALWMARTRFCDNGKASFRTFAVHYVRGKIANYLRDKSDIVRVPGREYEAGVRVICYSIDQELEGGEGGEAYSKFLVDDNAMQESRILDVLSVRAAVAKLSARDREILILRGVGELDFIEIAALHGGAQSASRYRFDQAAARLRGILGESHA